MDIKEFEGVLQKNLDDNKKEINEKFEGSKAEFEALEKKHNELQVKFDEAINTGNVSPEDFKAMQDQHDNMNIKMQGGNHQVQTKSFNEVIKETIEANAEKIKSLATNFGTENLEMKAVGDMSISGNFP